MTGAADESLRRILESAARLGVEVDEAEALRWLADAAAQAGDGAVVHDERAGVFGHRLSMLDFSSADLDHFRAVGRLVGIDDVPGVVETALALSGSAAQSRIQSYPGDADYFERVNIRAATRDEACAVLADLMRHKAMTTLRGPGHLLREVKFGGYPRPVVRDGVPRAVGAPIAWSPAEVSAGRVAVTEPDGTPASVTWDEVSGDPGWCKFDWVVSDPARGTLVNASNMLDVTWESPDGSIVPLDGFLDPYYQEVYLEAASVPIFAKVVQHVSADALDDYVDALEHEVTKYLTVDVNYGKAAKRMYNVFRLTGRYPEAAYVRELFDEPASLLYQVWALMRTMEECRLPGSGIPMSDVLDQADSLIVAVVDALEGGAEAVAVRALVRLRRGLEEQEAGHELTARVEQARAEVMALVNEFFRERLVQMPEIRLYMAEHGTVSR